jgi:hypothetical protein
MHAVGELILGFFAEIFFFLAYHTAKIVLRIVSFGLIRVKSLYGLDLNEPEFGWHNVIWKWDGKSLWLADHVALYLGFFLWLAALTALVYYWHPFG